MKNEFIKKRIFSTILIIIMTISLCIGRSLPASAAGATKQTITATFAVTNDLAEEMTSLKLSTEGTDTWGKELLTQPLKTGITVKIPITFTTDKPKWDIMAVTENGELVFAGLDFTGITAAAGGSIRLRYSIYNNIYGIVYNNAPAQQAVAVGKTAVTVVFTIKNDTLGEYETLQLSKPGKNAWGMNLLREPLKGGATVKIPITFSDDMTVWDLKGIGGPDVSNFTCKNLDFSGLTPESGGSINLRYSAAYGMQAELSSSVTKTPYPKQSGNNIMFFDTDSDGVLSAAETREQVAAANPDSQTGYDVTISDKIHTIGKNAFERRAVKKLTIPSTVKTIQDEAFMNADLLKDISFAEGLETIGQRAFVKTGLSSVTLPKSLRNIGSAAFGGCDQLTTITLQEGIATIGDGAFTGTFITSILLPNSLTNIGNAAFNKCINLKSITIPNGVQTIGNLAFNACTSLTEVNLTAVTSIGDQAFLECTKLQKINLPASLSKIGGLAFDSCKSLASITVDAANPAFTSQDGILYSKDMSAIYDYPNARADKSFVLPATVTSIKMGAFARTAIAEVILPAGLKTIESYAFTECKALKSSVLPEGIATIEEGAFDQCIALTGDLVLPKSIKKYGNQAFRMTALKNVTINSNVNLSEMMFIGSKSLETVKIKGEFQEIGNMAFASCPMLKSINLPKTLKVIDTLAFSDCSSLPEIVLPEGLTKLGQKVVLERSRGVFNNCTSLKSIIIPNSVVYVEEEAFKGCSILKSAILSKNARYNLIEKNLFLDCTGLEAIVIPKNVIRIGDSAFSSSGLKKLTIEPNGCKYIDERAFQSTLLTEVVIPVGVKEIGSYSFSSIKPLKTVTISSTVTNVRPYTFYKVPSLTRVNVISTKKIDIAPFNFEDKAFIAKGVIHVPKNFSDLRKAPDGKLYYNSRKMINDLPILSNSSKSKG